MKMPKQAELWGGGRRVSELCCKGLRLSFHQQKENRLEKKGRAEGACASIPASVGWHDVKSST